MCFAWGGGLSWATGDVRPCCAFINHGNLSDEGSLAEIFSGEKANNLRRLISEDRIDELPPACPNCINLMRRPTAGEDFVQTDGRSRRSLIGIPRQRRERERGLLHGRADSFPAWLTRWWCPAWRTLQHRLHHVPAGPHEQNAARYPRSCQDRGRHCLRRLPSAIGGQPLVFPEASGHPQ